MSLTIKHFYRFGEFVLDSDQQVLLRDGKLVNGEPGLDSLRGDPRFDEVVRRIRLR